MPVARGWEMTLNWWLAADGEELALDSARYRFMPLNSRASFWTRLPNGRPDCACADHGTRVLETSGRPCPHLTDFLARHCAGVYLYCRDASGRVVRMAQGTGTQFGPAESVDPPLVTSTPR